MFSRNKKQQNGIQTLKNVNSTLKIRISQRTSFLWSGKTNIFGLSTLRAIKAQTDNSIRSLNIPVQSLFQKQNRKRRLNSFSPLMMIGYWETNKYKKTVPRTDEKNQSEFINEIHSLSKPHRWNRRLIKTNVTESDLFNSWISNCYARKQISWFTVKDLWTLLLSKIAKMKMKLKK